MKKTGSQSGPKQRLVQPYEVSGRQLPISRSTLNVQGEVPLDVVNPGAVIGGNARDSRKQIVFFVNMLPDLSDAELDRRIDEVEAAIRATLVQGGSWFFKTYPSLNFLNIPDPRIDPNGPDNMQIRYAAGEIVRFWYYHEMLSRQLTADFAAAALYRRDFGSLLWSQRVTSAIRPNITNNWSSGPGAWSISKEGYDTIVHNTRSVVTPQSLENSTVLGYTIWLDRYTKDPADMPFGVPSPDFFGAGQVDASAPPAMPAPINMIHAQGVANAVINWNDAYRASLRFSEAYGVFGSWIRSRIIDDTDRYMHRYAATFQSPGSEISKVFGSDGPFPWATVSVNNTIIDKAVTSQEPWDLQDYTSKTRRYYDVPGPMPVQKPMSGGGVFGVPDPYLRNGPGGLVQVSDVYEPADNTSPFRWGDFVRVRTANAIAQMQAAVAGTAAYNRAWNAISRNIGLWTDDRDALRYYLEHNITGSLELSSLGYLGYDFRDRNLNYAFWHVAGREDDAGEFARVAQDFPEDARQLQAGKASLTLATGLIPYPQTPLDVVVDGLDSFQPHVGWMAELVNLYELLSSTFEVWSKQEDSRVEAIVNRSASHGTCFVNPEKVDQGVIVPEAASGQIYNHSAVTACGAYILLQDELLSPAGTSEPDESWTYMQAFDVYASPEAPNLWANQAVRQQMGDALLFIGDAVGSLANRHLFRKDISPFALGAFATAVTSRLIYPLPVKPFVRTGVEPMKDFADMTAAEVFFQSNNNSWHVTPWGDVEEDPDGENFHGFTSWRHVPVYSAWRYYLPHLAQTVDRQFAKSLKGMQRYLTRRFQEMYGAGYPNGSDLISILAGRISPDIANSIRLPPDFLKVSSAVAQQSTGGRNEGGRSKEGFKKPGNNKRGRSTKTNSKQASRSEQGKKVGQHPYAGDNIPQTGDSHSVHSVSDAKEPTATNSVEGIDPRTAGSAKPAL